MSGPLTKKPGPRLPSRRPGEVSELLKLYPRHTDLQAIAIARAAAVTDTAERFLSALWRALAEGQRLPVGAESVDFPIDAMPTPATCNLLRILAGCAERGVKPTADLILTIGRDPELNIVTCGGDERAALMAVLERESTSAGLANHARFLATAHRKRLQAARLHRRLARLIDFLLIRERRPAKSETPRASSEDCGPSSKPNRTPRISRRAIAAVCGGVNNE